MVAGSPDTQSAYRVIGLFTIESVYRKPGYEDWRA